MAYCLVACTHVTELGVEVKELIEIEKEAQFPVLDNSLFGESIEMPNKAALLQLDSNQIKEFLEYAQSEENNKDEPYQHVYKYLETKSDGFKYVSKTHDASTTLATQSGNCMSLAMLTAALATFYDVEIDYQLVNRLPVYQEYGDIVFSAKHIRSVLYPPKVVSEQTVISISQIRAVVDYYPSRYNYVSANVDENGLLGQYFRNLSAESLSENDYRSSYYYLLEAFKYQPEHEEAINNMAILHRRIGAVEKAEELYRYGIKHASQKLSLLKNYKAFLNLQGRNQEAILIEKELEKYNDPDPFPWMHSANEAYEASDYKTALSHYERAIELAPYFHQAHFGKAKSLYKLGRMADSEFALQRAKEEAFDTDSQDIYVAKLEALNREKLN